MAARRVRKKKNTWNGTICVKCSDCGLRCHRAPGDMYGGWKPRCPACGGPLNRLREA